MTIRDIITNVRDLIGEVNRRFKEYREKTSAEADNMNKVFMREHTKLHKSSDIVDFEYEDIENTETLQVHPYRRITDPVTGKKRKMRKSELLEQQKALEKFIEKDVYSPSGERKTNEANIRKYESFIKNHRLSRDDFGMDDWFDMIEQFNMIKDDTYNYGYEDNKSAASARESYVQEYLDRDRIGRKTFGDSVREAYESLVDEGEEITYQSIIDKLSTTLKRK